MIWATGAAAGAAGIFACGVLGLDGGCFLVGAGNGVRLTAGGGPLGGTLAGILLASTEAVAFDAVAGAVVPGGLLELAELDATSSSLISRIVIVLSGSQ